MDIVLVTALCNHTFRLPQVILDVGVELNGFGPAVAEDGLTDVLFVVGWHGTVAAVVFVVALTVEMVDEMLLQQPQLLAGSNYPPDWDGPVGYTPGIADDKHQLA